jgi:hypothetical protein
MLGWVWSRIKGAFNHWVEGLILLGAGIAILTLRGARDELPEDVTLPTWLFAFVIGVPSVLAVLVLVAAWRGRGGAPVTVLQQQLALSAYYSKHVYDALETLQKILTGTIPSVSVATAGSRSATPYTRLLDSLVSGSRTVSVTVFSSSSKV